MKSKKYTLFCLSRWDESKIVWIEWDKPKNAGFAVLLLLTRPVAYLEFCKTLSVTVMCKSKKGRKLDNFSSQS